MAETAKKVKGRLKFRAPETEGVLSVKVGSKRLTLPGKVRVLEGDGYLFLSIKSSIELYRVEDGDLRVLSADEPADEAASALGKLGTSRRASTPTLPRDLENALKAVPDGYRVSYEKDGTPRLVKKRTRKGA